MKFGSCLASENQENEIVSIPGLRGREPKEISLKNLANIIQARMEEIVEHVLYEIKNSNYERKLIAGIVLTGGGSQMRHLQQLVEYMTGMGTRIGYPNEHLAKGNAEEITSPTFATSVGLVMKGLEKFDRVQKVEPAPVKGHSKKDKKGSFFERLLDTGKRFFEEDE